MRKGVRTDFLRQRRVICCIFGVLSLQAVVLSYFVYAKGDSQPELEQRSEIKAEEAFFSTTQKTKHNKHSARNYYGNKPVSASEWCKNKDSFVDTISFDPFMKYVPDEIETPSPLRNCDSGVDFSMKYVPGRTWWSSKGVRRYGGFTADMGWILLVARLAMFDSVAIEFPTYWGHGCDTSIPSNKYTKEPGWTCFFQPITKPGCVDQLAVKEQQFLQEREQDRHRAKLYHVYKDPNQIMHRNQPIISNFIKPWFDIKADNDVQTMRQVFKWIFRLKPEVRARVDKIKKRLRKITNIGDKDDFIGIHIRGGDKVGHNDGGPVEAYEIPAEVYAETVRCFYKFSEKQISPKKIVFVASDEYSLVEKLQEVLGKQFNVVTSVSKDEKGFSIEQYRENQNADKLKFDKAVSLWADMELLAEAEVFAASLQSNVARMIHLLRLGKPSNTTLPIPFTRNRAHTCCKKNTEDAMLRNCFWICT